VLQITPQMRILVALEAVDGRNYALSNNMRSFYRSPKISHLATDANSA
jgi:hypothetical protein